MVENYIKEKLGLDDNLLENRKKLQNKLNEVNEVAEYLRSMLDNYKKQLGEKIITDFPQCSLIPREDKVVVKIPIKEACIYAEIDNKGYGFSTNSGNVPRDGAILNDIKPILEKLAIPIWKDNNSCWYGCKDYSDWNEAYCKIIEFIQELNV